MMTKEKKKIYIKEMKDFFSKTSSIFVTHYQGLTVKEIDGLKSEMRKYGILFKITKNNDYFACTWLKNCYFGARKK